MESAGLLHEHEEVALRTFHGEVCRSRSAASLRVGDSPHAAVAPPPIPQRLAEIGPGAVILDEQKLELRIGLGGDAADGLVEILDTGDRNDDLKIDVVRDLLGKFVDHSSRALGGRVEDLPCGEAVQSPASFQPAAPSLQPAMNGFL
jgi:hypothetical protein